MATDQIEIYKLPKDHPAHKSFKKKWIRRGKRVKAELVTTTGVDVANACYNLDESDFVAISEAIAVVSRHIQACKEAKRFDILEDMNTRLDHLRQIQRNTHKLGARLQ
jgi:hypothetical protein